MGKFELRQLLLDAREKVKSHPYTWGWNERECRDVSPDEYQNSDLEMLNFLDECFLNKGYLTLLGKRWLEKLN